MSKFNRLLSFFLIIVLMSQPIVSQASTGDDSKFLRAYDLMTKLSILEQNNKTEVSTVTRAEFSSYVLRLIGLETGEKISDEDKELHSNYIDSSEFDENGDWIWKTESEREDEHIQETATPFRDVTSEHLRWPDISTIAQLGYMRGDGNKYFRPDEAITGYEAIKVLVDLCGGRLFAEGEYPLGYIRVAKKLGITTGIESRIGDHPISYGTLIIALYNTLHAEPYIINGVSSNGTVNLAQYDECTFLEQWKGIKYFEGIVDCTRLTGLSHGNGTGDDSIKIAGNKFHCGDLANEELLGLNVRVYYSDENDINECIYIEKLDKNKELIIKSADIVNYKNPKLIYENGNKTREVYVGADTNIIYNGKYIDDYTDDIFSFDKVSGQIKLIDATGDGKYETAIITKSEVFWIDMVDYQNEIIYDKIFDAPSTLAGSITRAENFVKLDDGEVIITDSLGYEMAIDNIMKDAVAYVQKTLPSQGESVVKIICCYEMISGKTEMITSSEKIVVIDGKEYEIADIVDVSKLTLGTMADFFLDPDGKIVAFRSQGELTLGYLVASSTGTGLFDSEDCKIKIYHLNDDEMKIYNVAKKIKFNKTGVKAKDALIRQEIYDSNSKQAIAQPIKYKLNTNGEICEILTANYDVHEFYVETLDEWFAYRNTGMLYSGKPRYYTNSSTKYINVPKLNVNEDESFFRLQLRHNKYDHYVNMVCKDDIDSNFVTALIKKEDTAALTIAEHATVYLIRQIGKRLNSNGDVCWYLSLQTPKASTEVEVDDRDAETLCADLESGDLIRAEMGGKSGGIKKLEKVFDVGTRSMMTTDNPPAAGIGGSISMKLHGCVTSKSDSDKIVNLTPYLYTLENGQLTKRLAEITPENNYPINASVFSILVYDVERQITETGSYITDIMSMDVTGQENDIVVCMGYGDPIGIFVYR